MNFSTENSKGLTLIEALMAAREQLGRELTQPELNDLIAHFRDLRSQALRRELNGETPSAASNDVRVSSSELSQLITELNAKRNQILKESIERKEWEKRTTDEANRYGILIPFKDGKPDLDEAARLIEEKKNELEREKILSEEQEKLRIEDLTSMELPLDWENSFDTDERAQGVHADTVQDGLTLSLASLARVDIEYISSITGKDCKTVITTLKGSIYQNPETWGEVFYKGWETAEEYLSGNLIHKRRVADEANKKYYGYFQDNLDAIDKVIPAPLSNNEIYVTVGSPWVPAEMIDAFINHILKLKYPYAGVIHDEVTGSWEIPLKGDWRYSTTVAATKTYGTMRLPALNILERTLNMKTVSVYDQAYDQFTGKNHRVLNKQETMLAIEKQQKIIEEFQNWIWKDESRKQTLTQIYESKYSCVRRRIFDGSFLQFPNMNPNITLFPYQKNAVARILFSANTLLAHDVGSGKTYIMITAGLEARRMGISKKNLYVVPNNIVGQWEKLFKELYPSCDIMVVTPSKFTPQKRQDTLAKIRDEDHDAILMPYSCFDAIPLSLDYYMDTLKEEKDELEAKSKQKKKATAHVKRKLEQLKTKIQALEKEDKSKRSIYFDELGINRLFVDEMHNYKNIPIETQVSHVLGISAGNSKKCKEMLEKVHFVQRTNNGGGVVMATGTPITNSVTDAFAVQKYLQSGDLALMDLQTFDSWIGMFAEKVTEFEIDVDTNSYRLATRFSKFHNLPELTSMLSSIADFHQVDASAGIPDFRGYSDTLIPKTKRFSDFLNKISERADNVRSGKVKRKQDNMLLITTDGRKAALDLRLVDGRVGFDINSKVQACADNVEYVYKQTAVERLTQLVFCDTSTPKAGFNLYDELKRILVSKGVNPDEIAFVHDADTERKREKLFDKVRKGEIRILLGSTFKLGIGVNVQDKLVALHHLDVPWRPADMTQREGRILRQGNTNKQVLIYRYITEGSFDAYSWQLLETKQRFITDLLSGSLSARSGSDVDRIVLDYAEVKALAIGNPLIKERCECSNRLNRLLSLQRTAIENRILLEQELASLPQKIENQARIIEKTKADIEHYAIHKEPFEHKVKKELSEMIYNALCEHAMSPEEESFIEYQGFDIILPQNMPETKPYVWVQRNGRYFLEIFTTTGALARVDYMLDNLDKTLQKQTEVYDHYVESEKNAREELAREQGYTEQIAECKEKLKKLDKKLGIGDKK